MRCAATMPRLLPALLVVLGGAGLAAAQHDSAGPGGGPSLPPPSAPGMTVATPPEPPEPVSAEVELFAGATGLRSLSVRPDTVDFGGLVWIVAAPDRSGAAPTDSLALPAWLEAAPDERRPADLDAPADALVLPARVYGIAPFSLASGGLESGLVHVRGTTDGSQTAPVRQPRRPGWDLRTILVLVLAAGLAVALGAWLWRRRRGPRTGPQDRLPAGPAWPDAALRLERLLNDLQADGDTRVFLDGVAALARSYAADRFLIAAREMTGEEIAAACDRLGYPASVGRGFSNVVTAADRRRFDPEPLSESWCRDRAGELVAAIEAVRLEAAGPQAAAAGVRWRDLAGRLATGGGAAR